MSGAAAWMAGWVTAWMDQRPWETLQRQIQAEGPLADQLIQQYPPLMRRFALGTLRPDQVQALRMAGTAEWEAVLDHLLATRPHIGGLLWSHKAWFHRQLDAARTQFLAS